jgi:two-component system sensor histidine kinase KdpD
MTRLQSGALQINKEIQPIEEVIGAALNRLEAPLRERSITTNVPDKLPMVAIDAVLMEQVFVNLIENALKYTQPSDKIELEAQPMPDNSLLIQVHDSGPGIQPNEEERVFEKFFRSKDTDASIFGAGLGLAICRGIVQAHGGSIWAERSRLGGACISMKLPSAQPAELEAQQLRK